jgi:type IV pilus assembly protein PilM
VFEAFRSRNGSPIGLDVGAFSVKMLQMERRGSGWVAVAAQSRALAPDLPAEGAARVAAITAVVQDMLHQGGFRGRNVVSCLPATAMQYKNLRLPKMPADELRSAVEWEAHDRLHMAADNVSIQFFDAGEVRQGDDLRQEIILLAAPHKLVDEHLQILLNTGLTPLAIDAVPSAMARAMDTSSETDLESPARLVIDVGLSSTKVLITRHGRVLFFKLIEVGGRTLDETVAQHLSLPISDAAEVRRRLQQQVSPEDGEQMLFGSTRRQSVERAVFEAMRVKIGELAKEIGLCLRYYSVTFRGHRPNDALLVGGEAYEPQVPKILSGELGIRVEPARPLAHVDLTAVPSLAQNGGSLSEWAVAAGLAMRPIERVAKRGAA